MEYQKLNIEHQKLNCKKEKLYRSYTLLSEQDLNSIKNGKCPNYALSWGIEYNKTYWKPEHDFLKGFKNTINNDK
jgi:hypothetical protein